MTNLPSPPADSVVRIGSLAPDFVARTTKGDVRLSDYRGRWLLFFSHPADFTPVCTSEFLAFTKAAPMLEELDCALLGLSVDSLYAHLAWVAAIKDATGVEVAFPIIEDPSMMIARAYGMIDEAAVTSSTVRATYVLDPEGVVRAMISYPATVGRSVDEMIRLLKALQAVSPTRLAPEGWRPGDAMLRPAVETQEAMLGDRAEPWFYRSAE